VRFAKACGAPVLAFLVVATGWGAFVLHGTTWLAAGVAGLAFAAFAVTHVGLRAKRHRAALIGSMLLAASPALLAGTLRFPAVLVSSVDSGYTLTAADAATAPETFGLLNWFAPPAIAVLIVVQWLTWRTHRRPVDQRSLLHF
jgi:cytochrome d ubiquinol oxidase subunit II